MEPVQTDVVVVGAGNAGLVAALAASEAGARVILLEAAPEAERGGNSSFAGGLFRTAHEGLASLEPLVGGPADGRPLRCAPYPPEAFERDWLAASGGAVDLDLMRTVIDGSFDTLMWMKGKGVQWYLSVDHNFDPANFDADAIADVPPGGAVRARGKGAALVATLFRAAEAAGVDVWYDSPVCGLLTSGETVRGVTVRRPADTVEVHGAVVLAAGGFEANAEMRARYLGSGWDVVKVRGSRFNMGTVLSKALDAGAQPAGRWEGCHATPVDTASPPVGDVGMTDRYSRHAYPYALLVNLAAERFMDEGEDLMYVTYAKTGAAVRGQPRSIAFQLFDQRTLRLLEPRYETGTPVVGDTLADVAAQIGVPAAALERTVEAFNEAVPADAAARFNPFALDGVSAEPGGQPPKSNWALPLDSPPYVVYPCTCGITFTFGGLRVDVGAQVLTVEGRPMAGLYAAGEITGAGFYYNYPGGAGLMRGAVLGRIAGRNAARSALHA